MRLYLDPDVQPAHIPSSAITGDTKIDLSASDIGYVFANSMGTLAYRGPGGSYSYVAQTDSNAAYQGRPLSRGPDFQFPPEYLHHGRADRILQSLDASIANLSNRLGTTFGGVTKTTINGPTPTPTPHSDPTPTAPTPTPTPTPTDANAHADPNAHADVWRSAGVKMTTVSDWGTGRTMDVAVTNAGAAATTSWSVTFSWPGTSHRGTPAGCPSGGKVTVGNSAWNGALACGAATTFGFTDSRHRCPAPAVAQPPSTMRPAVAPSRRDSTSTLNGPNAATRRNP